MTVHRERAAHVFVLPCDLTRLAADAWLLPTDARLTIEQYWEDAVPCLRARVAQLGDALADFRAGRVRGVALGDGDGPVPVPAQVPLEGLTDAAQIVGPLSDALRAAAPVARTRAQERGPTARRGLPLVATPLFGSRGGGGDRFRGELIHHILETAARIGAEQGVDVALVLRDAADLAHAHRLRRDRPGTWAQLAPDLVERAQALAAEARAGRLVPFIGAGVSASAGLPLWNELLDRLLVESALPVEQHDAFRALPVLDQAHVLRALQPDSATFNALVAGHARAGHYGLAPALLAALPTTEAVTLNYDELYEMAAADVRRPVALLPEQGVGVGGRWLLKLHGTVTDPSTIVLTRQDYLGYGRGREALFALAKAMLLTRHLLFVGFGLADDHFHELMHDVREVLPRGERRAALGTALLLAPDPLRTLMWSGELDLLAMGGVDIPGQVRHLEIFLDCLLAHADQGLSFFLNDRYAERLSGGERALRARLLRLRDEAAPEERDTAAWDRVRDLLDSLDGRE